MKVGLSGEIHWLHTITNYEKIIMMLDKISPASCCTVTVKYIHK